MKHEEKEVKISFMSKDQLKCPSCDMAFHREELLSGSGRLIAGQLTEELHRLYEPSAKYGNVYPLIYQATVCPKCWFASMDKDFESLPAQYKSNARNDIEGRKKEISGIFPDLDFAAQRNLESGTASLYLVVRCYDIYPKEFSPTMKQGIASLRASWLFTELDAKNPGQHYNWLADLFKKKALFFYDEAIKREQGGKESLSGIKVFGPDTDKNYAYEGALYLSALLKYKYGFHDNLELRSPCLEDAKRSIAKLFGIGKSSKNKPGPLLEHARALYDNITKELSEADA